MLAAAPVEDEPDEADETGAVEASAASKDWVTA